MESVRYLTCGEAVSRLGFSRSTLRRAVAAGRVKAKTTPGGHLRFDLDELRRFAEELVARGVDAHA